MGLTHGYDRKPKRRLFEALKSQGLQANQEVRALTELVTPADESAGADLSAMLERIKWWLWHGNSHQAEQAIEAFEADIDALEVDYANLGKLVRAAHEFAGYIRHNTASLINYGERYRSGEPISSAAADAHPRARRDAASALRALVSRLGQRQLNRRSAGCCLRPHKSSCSPTSGP